MSDKIILDAACGGRYFWIDKHHPNAIYIDNRQELGLIKMQPNFKVDPDVIMDFTDLKFNDGQFKLVVWDPPHLTNLGKTSIMRAKYGGLNPDSWRGILRKGFSECWRVLADNGILIFKWNEESIRKEEVLKQFTIKPLFGHPVGSKNKTHWLCFMKIKSRDHQSGEHNKVPGGKA